METNEEYNKVCDMVWGYKRAFMFKHHVKPNTVYLGYREMNAIKAGLHFLSENGAKRDRKDWTVFGMSIVEVRDDNHLSIGLTIKEETV